MLARPTKKCVFNSVMRSNLEIQRLITEKIGGIISAADEVYLDHLIATDRRVADMWKHTKSLYHQEDLDNNFQRFDDLPWKEISFQPAEDTVSKLMTSQPAKRMHRLRPVIWAAATISMILIIAGGWFFRSRTTTNIPLSLLNTTAGVQLVLGDGQVLNLSKDSGILHIGATQVINTNNTLSLPESTIPDKQGNENLTLAVPIGKYYTIKLSDGTEVALNAASTLRFPVPFSADTREVYLSGEAFLTVAKDAARPFLVHTAQGTVQVLGTSFNVNSYDSGSVKVSLVEGTVKMEEVTLKPGQQAVATNTGIRVQPFDEPEELSWRRGVFYFSNTTLADIARILPRWFGIPVIMDNNSIATETFTGSLERSQPVTVFLDNLKSTTTVDYYFDKNGRLHFK